MNGLADAVGRADLTLFPTIALVIFFAIFVGIVLWVLLRGSKPWERARHLPLEDDDSQGSYQTRRKP